ncbi:UvrD-helicase domain-containing protein [Mesonia aquimarina]|uniref:UvrD-helicase domain-containing protein n=1 Tax=Mesonia aquimarina TaxID=1504967 RepID=UPI000EF59D42|nr:UvrD-helicase domain-containing protein [Mesonia aquimarina]
MKNTHPFTVYDASAGSGKTFTLVVNYLSILLLSPQKDAYKNILAITFTNKAVNEMKSRVIATITAFTEEEIPEKYKQIFVEIQRKTGLPANEIQQKSKQILKSLLHNYAAFEISTIDGFTHRILRTFAKDLGIPVNFEVELDTESILHEAVDRLVAKAGEDKQLTKVLVNFALSKADDDKSWDISRDLYEIANLLVNENNLTALQVLRNKTLDDFNAFAEELKVEQKKSTEKINNIGKDFFQLLTKHQIDSKSFSGNYVPKYFQKLVDNNLSTLYKPKAKWQENIATASLYPKKATEEDKILLDKFQPKIAGLYTESEELLYKLDFLKEIQKKITPLSLLTAINQEVDRIKKERKLLLISEFNQKISKSIQHQPAPFIYERLGERYRHYFIDEFQDTSQLQWQNLIPLIENNLASGTGSLSLVGDAKQSIYRWRGGKAEQFIKLAQKEPVFPIEQEPIKLPANYRSQPEIVNFNNQFFAHAAQFLSLDVYEELFKNATQEIKKEAGGYVNISFVEAQNKKEEYDVYPEKVLAIIEQLEEKNYAKKDICILVRKKAEGIAVANFLNEHQIPIISSETLLINQSPKVRFMTSVLAFSLRPTDADLKFEILDFLFEEIAPEENHYQFVSKYLQENGAAFFSQFKEINVHFNLTVLQRFPLYDAVEYIIRSFSLSSEANAYLQFFLDVIYEFVQNHSSGVAGFLDYWENKKEKLSIVAPEGEDAVQIMTVHKSKGLEFPIVIYPFANQPLNDTRLDSLWVPLTEKPNSIPIAYLDAKKNMTHYSENSAALYEQLVNQNELDALNVLYVALTRAEQQLYVISKLDLDRNGQEKTTTFSGLFINYLKAQEKWNAEIQEYEFGDLPEFSSAIKKEESTSVLEFISSAPADHNLSIITKSGSLWQTSQEKAIREGNLIHEILYRIKYKEDVEDVLEQAVLEGLLVKKEQQHYKELLYIVLNHPDLAEFYTEAYHIFNEEEILTQGEYKRLDRLCIQGNSASIIDYKTGSFSTSHTQQILNYANAIEEMGYQIDKKLLVYLNDEVTIKNV